MLKFQELQLKSLNSNHSFITFQETPKDRVVKIVDFGVMKDLG